MEKHGKEKITRKELLCNYFEILILENISTWKNGTPNQ